MPPSTRFNRPPRAWLALPAAQVRVPNPPNYPTASTGNNLLWTILPSAMMLVSALVGFGVSAGNGAGNVMSGMFVLMALAYPSALLMQQRAAKKQRAADTERLKREYAEDIRALVTRLAALRTEQQQALREWHPAGAVLLQRAVERDLRLWERRPPDEDFLHIRLGLGEVEPSYGLELQPVENGRQTDRIFANAQAEPFQRVPDAPLTLDLIGAHSIGIAGPRAARSGLARTLLANVATHHQPNEVRIFFVRDPRIRDETWGWLRWLPHVRAEARTLAAAPIAVREMLQGQLDELRRRETAARGDDAESKRAAQGWPYLLFVVENPALVAGHAAFETILRVGAQIRAGAVFLTEHVHDIPDGCGARVEVDARRLTITRDRPAARPIVGTPELTSAAACERLARALASLQVAQEMDLPASLRLSALLGGDARCQVDLPALWRSYAHPSRQLTAPIGIGSGGAPVVLDLHNNVHGPHGLIAGTTGSGKTVLLSTLLASLAACNSPRLVNFVIIDMKGDPKLELLRELPHTVGFASALPNGALKTKNHIRNYIARAIKALENEINTRMQKLNAANVQGDNFDYNARCPEDPIASLLVVVDEFAVLKREFPELMTALIDVAATGRQPGVHLILATQSPSGVVDDKIWANSQFRLCLRVANREESHSILRRAEAARLPGRPPGRALLQVGGDPDAPLERLQVASAGFAIRGAEAEGIEERFEIYEVLGDGSKELLYPQTGDRAVEPEGQTELQQLVYLSDKAARALHIPLPLPGPWLPPLPERLPLDALWDEAPPRRRFVDGDWTPETEAPRLRFPFGRIDQPAARRQPVLIFDLGRQHPNLWIAGRPGAGADLAVRTLVLALAEQHTPDELELYCLAFSGGALQPFKALPHTADYLTLRDEAGLRAVLAALQIEVERRRTLFATAGVDNAEHYRQKTGAPLASIVIVLDGFDVLYREAQLAAYDSVLGEFKDRIEGLLRAGCDLHVVLTTVTATLFRDGIEKNVTGRIALQLQDRADYFGVLGAPPPFMIDDARGRALWRDGAEVFELQLAAPTSADTPAAETEALTARAEAMAFGWATGGGRRRTALDRSRDSAAEGSATDGAPDEDSVARASQSPLKERGVGLNISLATYTPLDVPDLNALPSDDLSWLPDGVERVEFQAAAEAAPVSIDLAGLRRIPPGVASEAVTLEGPAHG
ncbi:MAG: DUF87 domain-containing protein [Anaerolineales bacterium]|nr:DUF87 domain-containing protein [Anaerolineales bacterium]